jgi:GNAT superfamily N-acetyltransferase
MAMAATFQLEAFTESLGREAEPLIEGHHAEVSGLLAKHIPARIPFEHYQALEDLGKLRVFTLREDGVLKGYNVFMFTEHHQHGTLAAFHDTLFVHPSIRRGTTGLRFLRWCDERLREHGAKFITQHVSEGKDIGPLFLRLGYKPAETIYIKPL